MNSQGSVTGLPALGVFVSWLTSQVSSLTLVDVVSISLAVITGFCLIANVVINWKRYKAMHSNSSGQG
ncbi:MAG: hypothetical protein KTR20_12785 [Cellvibrionaceae bacterium]|nr:hypothetical protein [Cellvibrionaceae bacterium]